MLQQSTVDLEDARRMLVGGEAQTRDLCQPIDIAVVDNRRNLGTDCHARDGTIRLVP